MAKYVGRLEFHSETGTEGGYWSFFDMSRQHTADDLRDGECPWGSDYCPVVMGTWHTHASYEGLHTLKNGDWLEIYTPEGVLHWRGVVQLSDFTVFEEEFHGWWVHNHPLNCNIEHWGYAFFMEYPAVLITNDVDTE